MIKQVIYLSFAAIAVLAGVVSAGTYSGGGEGTAEEPYRIATAADMNNIGANTEDWGSHFVMVNDIDLAGYTGTQFSIIGNGITPFIGVFDGNGHTISGFTYTTTSTSYIGLFGCVDDANAVIKDLTLGAPDVSAADYSDYVASLVGYLQSGTISGCIVESGSVGGRNNTGGLVGWNSGGTISNCYATGSITGTDPTGGLVGVNSGTISNCYGTGSVSGQAQTGGLVGWNNGMISNCYSSASVSGEILYIGGLLGTNYGTISNCYATGSVTGTDFTGGLVGMNGGTVTNCYAEGSVSGDYVTGGLAGGNGGTGGTISNCYAVTEVSASGTSWQSSYSYYKYNNVVVNGIGYECLQDHTSSSSFEDDFAAGYWKLITGGLAGYNYNGTILASFYDVEIGGPDNGIGTPLLTSQMQTQATFTDAGWDFIDETTNGIEDIWRLCEDGTDYPKLAWQMIMLGDFVCGDGVDFNDLDVFMQQWLMEKLSADVAVGGGDGVVDFLDWAVLADGWQNTTDLNDVADFADQWLQLGAYCADIAPTPAGDGVVDMLDFGVLAGNWLEGI